MTTDQHSLAARDDIDLRVRRDQATATLRSTTTALPSNTVVACVVSLMLWKQIPSAFLIAWLGTIGTVNLVRYAVPRKARLARLVENSPDAFLRLSWFGALVAGLTWAVLPVFCDTILGQHPSLLLFILSGLAAGAVALGSAHAPTAIAFAIPLLTATIIGRLSIGDYENLLFGFVATFLTVMLARSSLIAQRDFREASPRNIPPTHWPKRCASPTRPPQPTPRCCSVWPITTVSPGSRAAEPSPRGSRPTSPWRAAGDRAF